MHWNWEMFKRSVDLLKSFLVGTLFVWSHTVVVFDFLQFAYVSLVSSTLCKLDGLLKKWNYPLSIRQKEDCTRVAELWHNKISHTTQFYTFK